MTTPIYGAGAQNAASPLTGAEVVQIDAGGVVLEQATAQQIANLGAQAAPYSTIAAAGASQGTAKAITVTMGVVGVSSSASSEGVQLPTAATGRKLTLLASTTKGFKAYGKLPLDVSNA